MNREHKGFHRRTICQITAVIHKVVPRPEKDRRDIYNGKGCSLNQYFTVPANNFCNCVTENLPTMAALFIQHLKRQGGRVL
jgi:hypothetical protein